MTLAETSAVRGAVSSDEKGPTKEQIENAHTNRTITWGLFGTCVGILTFLLIIYYDFGGAGRFDGLLFQLSLSVIVVALFFFGFAGGYYFRVILPIRKVDLRAAYHLRVGDTLFVIGFLFLAAEPPLVLLTTGLYYAAGVAVILWFVSIALAYRLWSEFRG
jgi:hypothetical protein